MNGLIGRKVGMTSIFDEAGRNIACTVVQAGPCVITQIKSEDSDGYNSLQIGYGSKKEKNVSKALMGHYKKAGDQIPRKVVEFRDFELDDLNEPNGEEGGETEDLVAKAVGDVITAPEVFSEGDFVNVIGTSKGKGFQGVVKRHGFKGVNDATHGQHNRQRAPGAIGACSDPSKVFKGMRMGGQDGNRRVKTSGLQIIKILAEQNLVLIKGAVPGYKGSFVVIEK